MRVHTEGYIFSLYIHVFNIHIYIKFRGEQAEQCEALPIQDEERSGRYWQRRRGQGSTQTRAHYATDVPDQRKHDPRPHTVL